MEKAWGSSPGLHADCKGSHSGGYPFFFSAGREPLWRVIRAELPARG